MNKQEARPIKENPYSKMIEQMKKQGGSVNTPSIQIGRVVSPGPLVIQIGDLQVDRDNILITDYLLKDYVRSASIGSISATGMTNTTKEHKHSLNNLNIGQARVNFSGALNNGDRLAVLATADKQTYIVLAKLVKP